MNLQMAFQFQQMGRFDEAERIYLQLLNQNPSDKNINFALGALYQKQNKLDEAKPYFEVVIQSDPNHLLALMALGKIAHSNADYKLAIEYFERFTALKNDNAQIYFLLAECQIPLNQDLEAIKNVERGIELSPSGTQLAGVYNQLAVAYKDIGQTDQAKHYFHKALALDAKSYASYEALAQLEKHTEASQDLIDTLHQLLEDATISKEGIIQLNFALGKLYEDLQDYDKSFYHYHCANQQQRDLVEYATSLNQQEVSRLEALFSEPLAQMPQTKEYAKTPIFILGMPRSGTTLIEQILCSHSSVYGAGELMFLQDICRPVINAYALSGAKPSAESIETMAEHYVDGLQRFDCVEPFLTDKMPGNFRLIGFILALFPDAKIIHCKRDPIDTCFSIFKMHFNEGHKYKNDLTELGEYYLEYERLMAFWHQRFPGKIYDIHYQDVVDNFEQEVRDLLTYCQLEFEPSCLDFHKNQRKVLTASQGQVNQKIYKDALAYWKRYEKHLAPLIASLSNR